MPAGGLTVSIQRVPETRKCAKSHTIASPTTPLTQGSLLSRPSNTRTIIPYCPRVQTSVSRRRDFSCLPDVPCPPPPMCSSTSLSWEGEECAACQIRGPCCGSASVMSSSTRVSLMLVLSQARSGSKRSPLQRHRRPVARLSLQPPREPPWLIRRGHIKSEHASIRMFSIPSKCLSPCAS